MDLDQLRALLALVDHGSFARGARALGHSRGALRARIDALEAHLGKQLLVRTQRGVLPTEFCADFAPRARTLLRDAEALEASVRAHEDSASGVLHIAAPLGLPPRMVSAGLALMRIRHPELRVRAEYTLNPLNELGDHVDAILHIGPNPPEGPFQTVVLNRADNVLMASREYLDEHGRPTTLADLSAHDLMCWLSLESDGESLPLRAGGFHPIEPMFATNDTLLLRFLTMEGRGIAFMPNPTALNGSVPDEDFEIVLPDLVGAQGVMRVLMPQASAATARNRAHLAMIREFAQASRAMDAGIQDD